MACEYGMICGLGSAIQRTDAKLGGQWMAMMHDLNRYSTEGYCGEDDQRQSELLEIVQKVVNRRSPGVIKFPTKIRAQPLTTTYVMKHMNPRVATFCYWDARQPGGERGRLSAHSS
jgi:hypothetical protein